MSLPKITMTKQLVSFPRVSGDEPFVRNSPSIEALFSPRERGCAVDGGRFVAGGGVFPA